uniref:BLOC-1-related complex subunit 7 n=1 Tax=Parastrongyloides trichosuri TaxID=131310 RepID=A0A0N4Z508_PARTI
MDPDSFEGKRRLPKNIQDIIINTGNLITTIQQDSGSNEIMNSLIKQFVSLDPAIEGTQAGVNKLVTTLDGIEKYADSLTNMVPLVYDVNESLSKIKKDVAKEGSE